MNNLLQTLREFAKGKITNWDLKELQPMIHDVSDRRPAGTSKITVRFKDQDKLLQSLEISDDDIWFLRVVTSPYDNYNFYDSSRLEDNFADGYFIWNYTTPEMDEKLKELSKLLEVSNFDGSSEESRAKLAEKLMNVFPKETERFLTDLAYEINSSATRTASREITDKIDDALATIGASSDLYYEDLIFQVNDLIAALYRRGYEGDDLNDFIEKELETIDLRSNWFESSDEYVRDSDLNEFMEKEFDNYLDKVLEKIETETGEEDIKNFFSMIKRIKYKDGIWYDLPKLPKVKFKIVNFVLPNLIKVQIKDQKYGLKTFNTNEQNFNLLLYQPELFEFGSV
jgi:hypothetical protein